MRRISPESTLPGPTSMNVALEIAQRSDGLVKRTVP